jgi:hypothetical protein
VIDQKMAMVVARPYLVQCTRIAGGRICATTN